MDNFVCFVGFDVLPTGFRAAGDGCPDHGDLATALDCVESGFYSSVMIDASHEPLEENIRITRQVDIIIILQGQLQAFASMLFVVNNEDGLHG